ncbi:MAG: signal peptidase I [Verrucomicrobiales bacterium]|nr:signal peptidase I [Verrucomicrobiales bacterium]
MTTTWLDSLRTFAFGKRPVVTLVRIAVLVIATGLTFKYVILLRKIESTSMLPTLREGSIHVINRLAYLQGREPARGDIVAVRTSGETLMYIKRVVGLPGDQVEIRDGQVFINGDPFDEPYVKNRRRAWSWPTRGPRPRTLQKDEFFIVGDNRSMSQEQHEFGVIDRRRIAGKVQW